MVYFDSDVFAAGERCNGGDVASDDDVYTDVLGSSLGACMGKPEDSSDVLCELADSD